MIKRKGASKKYILSGYTTENKKKKKKRKKKSLAKYRGAGT